jgi:hypothetical protein
MADLCVQPEMLAAVRAEFTARKGDVVYTSCLPAGPPPVPKD